MTDPVPSQLETLDRSAVLRTQREDWFGRIQQFLEERIADAPDETCRAVARNLWQETADFTDDD